MKRLSFFIKMFVLALTGVAVLGSCSLMSDDLEPCPEGLDVRFVYDYNVERADMFKDHVGSVTLLVFDESGNLVLTQTESNSATARPLNSPTYTMHVEGLPYGRYRLKAIANQRDSRELRRLPGVRYQWTELQKGDQWNNITFTLTDTPQQTLPYQPATDLRQQLDTLWIGEGVEHDGIEAEYVSGQITQATVSLFRDTKRLHVSLRQLDHPDDCDIRDYDIQITDRNAVLAHDHSLPESNGTIVYHPFDEWNTYYQPEDGTAPEETAHADLDFNRLTLREGKDYPALLTIRHKSDNRLVAEVNLAETLAQGRGAFERDHYTPQEFLDRCYDYHLDFILVDGEWRFITLRIHTLPWSLHFQRFVAG